MDRYFSIIDTLIGLIIGGFIGYFSNYLIQGRSFRRQDEEKIHEEVYGKLIPILNKAKARNIPDEFEYKQWPGNFWLSSNDIFNIEEIFAKYSRLIPQKIVDLWMEAKEQGPSLEGPDEVETDNVFFVFDLEKLLNEVDHLTLKRS